MVESSDSALLVAARSGDGAAVEELLRRQQGRVYRFSLKMCRDSADAEDVLQETLLTVARKVADFRGASSLTTWLYAIARSYCIKKRRTSKYAPAREESLEGQAGDEAREVADGARLPDEEASGRELQRVLEGAISKLDDKYREVLLLRDVEGLTAREVAEVLDLGVAAVKSRLHRARAAVRARMLPVLEYDQAAPARGCPDVIELFSRKLEDEISQATCAEMEKHLDSCPACRDACDSLRRTLSLCSTVPAPHVPQAVQESVYQAIAEVIGNG